MTKEIIKVTVPRAGEVQIAPPPSLAVCFEFAALWSDELDQSQLSRLCAGALGICLDKLARYPKYRPMQDSPLNYGHKVLEALIRDGATPHIIFNEGTKALICMAGALPTNEEVEQKANFTKQKPEDST